MLGVGVSRQSGIMSYGFLVEAYDKEPLFKPFTARLLVPPNEGAFSSRVTRRYALLLGKPCLCFLWFLPSGRSLLDIFHRATRLGITTDL